MIQTIQCQQKATKGFTTCVSASDRTTIIRFAIADN